MDGCSKGNSRLSVVVGILRVHRGLLFDFFGSFLGHQPILYPKLMTVCEDLKFSIPLSYSLLEVKFDSSIVVFWIQSPLCIGIMLILCTEFTFCLPLPLSLSDMFIGKQLLPPIL